MRPFLVMLLLVLFAPWAAAEPLELRTASRDSEPMFIVRDGKVSGVCPDIYAALGRIDRDLKIRGVDRLLSLPLAERGLADGSLDINCSFGKSPQRDTYMRYLEEVVRTSMVVAVRVDDPIVDVKDLQELVRLSKQGDTIIVRRGTAFVERLEKLGAVIDNQSTDNKVNLSKLINRRGRFYYNIDYLMAAQLREPSAAGKIRMLPTAFEPQVTYIAVSNKVPPSVDKRIQAAMAELRTTGELQQILTRYGLSPSESK